MKKLIAFLGLLVMPVSVQAQTIEESDTAKTNGRVGNTTRIEALEAQAAETDSEQAVQDNRLDALEAGSGASEVPNWVVYKLDEVSGTFAPEPGIHVIAYPSNASESTASLLLRITQISDGKQVWFPGVWSVNAVTPTWQGTFGANYFVLGYPAGSGCIGDPTVLVLRTNTVGVGILALGTRAFDPRTGIIWRTSVGGGSTFDGDTYDVYEYGLEKGRLPAQTSTGCRTIIVGTTPEYPGNGRTAVLQDPVEYAATPYIYDGVAPRPSRTILPTGFLD